MFRPTELRISPEPNTALVLEGEGGRSVIIEYGLETRLRAWGDRIEYRVGERAGRARTVRVSARTGGDAGFVLAVPGRIERHYYGQLDVGAYQGRLVPVIVADLEIAVASAVAAESPPGARLEALKAQAVVTRSYYLAARHRHLGFDFCDTTHCQFLREPPRADAPPAVATTSTRGIVLQYKGSVLPALFSASCGGRTRSLLEVGLPSRGYPYFPVDCLPCLRLARPWTARLDSHDAALLLATGASERARLELDRKAGWSTVPGNNYRFELDAEGVILEGRGAGHGLGLCQLGAAVMAEEGADFQGILSHYFPNTSLRSDDKE